MTWHEEAPTTPPEPLIAFVAKLQDRGMVISDTEPVDSDKRGRTFIAETPVGHISIIALKLSWQLRLLPHGAKNFVDAADWKAVLEGKRHNWRTPLHHRVHRMARRNLIFRSPYRNQHSRTRQIDRIQNSTRKESSLGNHQWNRHRPPGTLARALLARRCHAQHNRRHERHRLPDHLCHLPFPVGKIHVGPQRMTLTTQHIPKGSSSSSSSTQGRSDPRKHGSPEEHPQRHTL